MTARGVDDKGGDTGNKWCESKGYANMKRLSSETGVLVVSHAILTVVVRLTSVASGHSKDLCLAALPPDGCR